MCKCPHILQYMLYHRSRDLLFHLIQFLVLWLLAFENLYDLSIIPITYDVHERRNQQKRYHLSVLDDQNKTLVGFIKFSVEKNYA